MTRYIRTTTKRIVRFSSPNTLTHSTSAPVMPVSETKDTKIFAPHGDEEQRRRLICGFTHGFNELRPFQTPRQETEDQDKGQADNCRRRCH